MAEKKEKTKFEKSSETFAKLSHPDEEDLTLEEVIDHSKAMYDIGKNYWVGNIETTGKGKDKKVQRRLGLRHLGDEEKAEGHAKKILQSWAEYALQQQGYSAEYIKEHLKKESNIESFYDMHANGTRLRNYQGVLEHIKNVRGFRKSMAEGELGGLHKKIHSSIHSSTEKKKDSLKEMLQERNSANLLKLVNSTLKNQNYDFEFQPGVDRQLLTQVYENLQNPKYKFSPDDVPMEYSSFLKKQKKAA